MEDLSALRKAIEECLIERLGTLTDADVLALRQQAQQLNLDNRAFSQLLQEVHTSINWSALRDKKQGTDRVVRPILIFNEEVRSLEKLGLVLFENKARALAYLQDNLLLKENLVYLSHQNVDLTINMMELYASEKNAEKRFLKVCYRLNSKLPFRLSDTDFATPEGLFEWAFTGYGCYAELFNKFASGHFHIWINSCFPEKKDVLSKGESFADFLHFLYNFEPSYPIYIGSVQFSDPQHIALKAIDNDTFWKPLLDAASDDYLFFWLVKRGYENLVEAFKERKRFLVENEKNQSVLSKLLVQALVEILNQETEAPIVNASLDKIELLNIQGEILQQGIEIQLRNKGFMRARMNLNKDISGISLSHNAFTLSHLEGMSNHVQLMVDPAKLIKNKIYDLSLTIWTDYGSIVIPIRLKAVFPLQAVLRYGLKYGIFIALFLCLIRLSIAAAMGNMAWLNPEVAWQHIDRQVPANHPAFIIAFIILLTIPILAWKKVKKIEQI